MPRPRNRKSSIVIKLAGQRFDQRGAIKQVPDQVRQTREIIHDLPQSIARQRATQLPQVRAQQILIDL